MLDALGRMNGTTAQPPFEEIDMVAAETGVRRAHERVQLPPATAEPGETKQGEQCAAEGGLAEPQATLDGVGNAKT